MLTYQAGRLRTRAGKRVADVYTYYGRKHDPDSGTPATILSIREIARAARRSLIEVQQYIECELDNSGKDAIDITDYVHELSTQLRRNQRHARMAAAGNPVSKTNAERLAKLRRSLLARKLAVFDKPKPDE